MTVVECESDTVFKSTGARASERLLYVTSRPADTPRPGDVVRALAHREHALGLDVNLKVVYKGVKCKSQRIRYFLILASPFAPALFCKGFAYK